MLTGAHAADEVRTQDLGPDAVTSAKIMNGRVCTYLTSSTNLIGLEGVGFPGGDLGRRTALYIDGTAGVGEWNLSATWAYTAP